MVPAAMCKKPVDVYVVRLGSLKHLLLAVTLIHCE